MVKLRFLAILILLIIPLSSAITQQLLPNPTIISSPTAWDYEATAGYKVYFNQNLNSGYSVMFTKENSEIQLLPQALQYRNNLNQLQQISMPQAVVGNPVGEKTFLYTNAYGTGRNLLYVIDSYQVKEELVITTPLPAPAQYIIDGGNPVVELTFQIGTNARMFISGALWDGGSTATTNTPIIIRNLAGNEIYRLPVPIAYDSAGRNITGTYELKKSSNKVYIGVRIPYSFFQTATYPVVIDPTFYADYSPIPARWYDNGNQFLPYYTDFDAPIDVTTTVTDGNTETRTTIEKKALGDDAILRVLFNNTYQSGHDYFLRFYKRNAQNTDILIYPHYNSTHANISKNVTQNVNGVGWFEIPITTLVVYMNGKIPAIDLRIAELNPIANIEVSEVMLRDEIDDGLAPVITNCMTNTTTLTCGQSAKLNCTITDDYSVSYATFKINGVDNLAIKNINEYYYTLSPLGYANTTYNWNATKGCDIFNQCTTNTQNINIQYTCTAPITCEENWIVQYDDVGSCQTNNTIQTLKTYIDLNDCGTYTELPVDNGTISQGYCNYCTPVWLAHTGDIHDCQVNGTRYVDYYDIANCYIITGLEEDEPPIDDDTWVLCTYFQNDFDCSISSQPYLKEKMEYTCILPSSLNDYECINQITYAQEDVLQVNPQKQEKSDSFINFNNKVETRESFTTKNGLLNAYYTNKNLVAETTFIITTICSDGNQTITSQSEIIPTYKNIDEVPTYALWVKSNAGYLVVGFIMVLILVWLIAFLVGQSKYR